MEKSLISANVMGGSYEKEILMTPGTIVVRVEIGDKWGAFANYELPNPVTVYDAPQEELDKVPDFVGNN